MNDPKNKLGQYAGLEQLSTQALEDLLQQDFAAGEDHSNPDLVMAIMEVMEQRTPQAAPAVDVDAAWNAFRAGNIAPMEPEADAAGPLPEAVPVPPSAAPQKPRRRKAPRRALAVAVVVCVLVCLFILPVQGSSLLQNLVQWSDANFSFLSRDPDGTEAVLRSPDYQQVEKNRVRADRPACFAHLVSAGQLRGAGGETYRGERLLLCGGFFSGRPGVPPVRGNL